MAMTTKLGAIDLMSPGTLEAGMALIAAGAAGCTLKKVFEHFDVWGKLDSKAEKDEYEALVEAEPEGYALDAVRTTVGSIYRAKMYKVKTRLWHVKGDWEVKDAPRLSRVELVTPVLNPETGVLESV